MHSSGFVYLQYKKKYYVNTHERTDVVAHRRVYVERELADEVNQAVWIQLSVQKARRLLFQSGGGDGDDGAGVPPLEQSNLYWKHRHEFDGQDGRKMVELHVHAFSFHQMKMMLEEKEEEWQGLRGCPSLLKDPAALITLTFGQDETVYKAYAMNQNSWTVDGVVLERPKGEGPGRMVSGMQGYADGYGMTITEDELVSINLS